MLHLAGLCLFGAVGPRNHVQLRGNLRRVNCTATVEFESPRLRQQQKADARLQPRVDGCSARTDRVRLRANAFPYHFIRCELADFDRDSTVGFAQNREDVGESPKARRRAYLEI